ncbi:MAG: ABC transporter permease [Alphaproteobacteria bacterium]|nr:ABC transporter permease [Alphaproteobacteria bacterium]
MNLKFSVDGRELHVDISGDWVGVYPDMAALDDKIQKHKIKSIVISGAGVGAWDSALLVFLARVTRTANAAGASCRLVRMPAGVARLMELVNRKSVAPNDNGGRLSFLERLGDMGVRGWNTVRRGLGFIGAAGASVGRWVRGRAVVRRVDWLFAFEDVGPRAILIVSLISFLIGLILAFVGAAQLKLFGAQVYVASLVAIASIRIMGAMMTGIIMAGRTGAAYAATIGTMQTNEELDALQTMGINRTDFLVLPRVVALVICMPILTLLADVMAVLGGAAVGVGMFHIPVMEYWNYTLMALDMQNFSVGIFHGIVYGAIIALCGCYYGMNCGRNANSVGVAATRAVVASIVWMVVATGIITFLFEVLGI